MKKANDWVKEQAVQKLEMYEFVRRIQIDAYNTAIHDACSNAKLISKSKQFTVMLGKTFETYSPMHGIKTIMVDEQSILKLLKDE